MQQSTKGTFFLQQERLSKSFWKLTEINSGEEDAGPFGRRGRHQVDHCVCGRAEEVSPAMPVALESYSLRVGVASFRYCISSLP